MTWNKRTSTPQKTPFRNLFGLTSAPRPKVKAWHAQKLPATQSLDLVIHIACTSSSSQRLIPSHSHTGVIWCFNASTVSFQNGSDETGDLWPHLLGNPGVRWRKCFGPKAALSVLMEDFLNHFEVCLDSRAGPSFSGAGCNILKLWKKCQVLATRLTYWHKCGNKHVNNQSGNLA